ncbi:MAG: hypothetical protein QXM10_09100 [Metallosphaera sp.]
MAQEVNQKDELPELFIRFEVAQYSRVLYVSDQEIDRPVVDLNSYFFDYINSHYFDEIMDFIEWVKNGGENELVCNDDRNELSIWKDYSPGQEWGDSFSYSCREKQSFLRFLESVEDYIRRRS